MIVPDLPPEESDELVGASGRPGSTPIFLVAPTSTEERLRAGRREGQGVCLLRLPDRGHRGPQPAFHTPFPSTWPA